MLFLQADTIPNTVNYMIAGYTVIFLALALYLASLVIRNRNAKRDLEMLEDIEKQEAKLPLAKPITTETQRHRENT
jgi:hypothetical protein